MSPWFVTILSLSVVACGGGSSDPTGVSNPMEEIQPMESPLPIVDPTPVPNPNPVDDQPANVDLESLINGSWFSECQVLAEGRISARQMFSFSDTQLVRDWYEYDGENCSGVPRGKTYPLSIDRYELGSEVITSDNMAAREINLTIVQLPETTYSPSLGSVAPLGLDVGDQRFTILSYRDGKVLWQDREPTNATNRPENFSNLVELSPRLALTSDSISPQDIYGIYKTACRANETDGTYVYNVNLVDELNGERYQDHLFFNHLCLGEPDAIVETQYALEIGSPFINDFGDTLLEVTRTRQPQTIVKGAELISFELKPGREARYDAYALVEETLLFGDCVLRVEDCKRAPEFSADHIDLEFNSAIRQERVETAEPATGTTDTSAIAGLWDGTTTKDGLQDIFYLQITENGLATYYDYLGDTFDAGDDCYFVYTENLSYFGDNAYSYEGIVGDEPYQYVDESSIVDSNLVSVGEFDAITNFTPYQGDANFNECI